MGKIRVLVVDDAVVVRKMVTDVLDGDPDIQVVGTAPNGKIALAKITQVNPDVITLDVEMPEMNGLETVAALRKQYPTLPVIMFSTLTERGASTTIEALTLGASDYVTKPANVGSVSQALQCLRDQLVPKVKLWYERSQKSTVGAPPPTPIKLASAPKVASTPKTIEIVALGVSTGGPNALSEVLPKLPKDFPVPIVLVQHMPPIFTRLLADRLDTQTSLRVCEAKPGQDLLAGHIYIAPGDYHLVVKREGVNVRLHTNQGPPENSCRPAVDVLFRSVVDVYGAGTLGVILTGMGQDGLRGCEKIREVGGQILAQDEASSVVWGMPGYIARAGIADQILPLSQIAQEMVTRVKRGRLDRMNRPNVVSVPQRALLGAAL